MKEADIRRALAEFVKDRDALVSARDDLNIKIIQTEQNIKNMQAALDETIFAAAHELEYGTIGLTEAIKTIIRRAGKHMTASEVRTSLKIIGFDLDRFANPTGAVTNTLQRLAKSGDLDYREGDQSYGVRVSQTPADAKELTRKQMEYWQRKTAEMKSKSTK